MSEVIVVGAGASGMLASIILAENGIKTTILERMDKVCKKLYATGNGKCNFTNLYISNECFNGGIENIMPIINKFDSVAIMDFFLDCGVMSYENNGYVYPHSRQASSIVKALETRARKAGVTINLKSNVKSVEENDEGGYKVVYEEDESKEPKKHRFVRKNITAPYVIIAAGGKSQKELGSDGSGTYFAKSLGHKIIKERPALCGVYTLEDTSSISGVRIIAKVNDEYGEIIFNEKGISGIPIFQLSSSIGKRLDKGENVTLDIDTIPKQAEAIVVKAIENNMSLGFENIYEGILPAKLGLYIMKINNIDKYTSVYEALDCLRMKMNINGLQDFDKSQVTSGGVSVKDINLDSFQSKIREGLYFCGEVVDVDGICGGYNLTFAWASGYIAARSIVENILDKEGENE